MVLREALPADRRSSAACRDRRDRIDGPTTQSVSGIPSELVDTVSTAVAAVGPTRGGEQGMQDSAGGRLEYAAASVLLRAPRAAVVIPRHDRWPALVAHVLGKTAGIWGGAGFALVPHNDGDVAPHWLRLMAGYDPDHVVAATMPVPDLMAFYPEAPVLVAGAPISAERARELGIDRETPLSNRDDQALWTIAAACTPFRRTREFGADNPRTRYEKARLPVRGEHDLVIVHDPGPVSPLLDFESGDTRLAAAWLASLLSPGAPGVVEAGDASSALGVEGHAALVRAAAESPGALAWAKAPGWHPSLRGLTMLLAWPIRDTYWVVVGDTLDDFALGHTLSRSTHGAVWLPDSWLDPGSPFASAAHSVLSHLRAAGFNSDVQVVSTSVGTAEACARLEGAYGSFFEPPETWLTARSLHDLTESVAGTSLALERDFDRDLLLPVMRTNSGDRTLVDKLPALVPETPVVAEIPSLDWVIDVALLDDSVPRGRGLPPDCLQGGPDPWRERIRSGRNGLAIMSSSFGFVPAGATLRQRTARPSLTIPSPQTWLTEVAGEAGLTVSTSEAGHLAGIATSLWNSRQQLAADLACFRPVFSEFLTDVSRTDARYPQGDGVVLRKEGFLAWGAIVRALGPDTSAVEVRALVDRLVERGAVRRGYIVDCPDCGRGQFAVPDDPDFSARCDRCQARIPLLARTWRQPVHEPTWYYDLHPSVRRLVSEHGDVALLAEHHLSGSIRRGIGLPEFELREEGRITAEIDLLYLSPDSVLIGEAKKFPTVARRELSKKAKGLVRAARALRADMIVLAAGEPGPWDATVVARMQEEIALASWPTGTTPSLRLLSGLWTGSVVDRAATENVPDPG